MKFANRLFVLLLLTIFFSSTAGIAEASNAVFSGSGWGHGVGFSQYGSRSMADNGWSVERIIEHYFPDTEIRDLKTLSSGSTILSEEKPLWIGLLQSQSGVSFIVEKGQVDLCFDKSNECPTKANAGEKWRFELTDNEKCYFSRLNDEGSYLPVTEEDECSGSLLLKDDGSSVVRLPRKGRTYDKGIFRFRMSPNSRKLHLSIQLNIEQYVKGIRELPDSWPGSSLEAQAIVSRTLGLYRLLDIGSSNTFTIERQNMCFCHLLDNDEEQAYGGLTSEQGHPFWQGRVGGTKGKVITWKGSIIWARYTPSSGGLTESNLASEGFFFPYLTSVDDHFSLRSNADNPFANWKKKISQSLIASIFGFSWLTNIEVVSNNESGSAADVLLSGIISGRPATIVTKGKTLRYKLDLHSPFFDVEVSQRFKDVGHSDPFSGEILGLSELGVTSGCTETTFCPSENVTREQMAAFIVRALKLKPLETPSDIFSDDDDSIFQTEIETLYSNGVTSGCTETTFCPSENVTREQMAAFIVRALTVAP